MQAGSGAGAPGRLAAWAGHAWAFLACVAVTALAAPLAERLDLTNIAMLYLAALVGLAYRFGRGPASLSAVLNVAVFDFFFVPPRFTLAVVDAQYLLTFAVMLAVGLVIGHLTASLRYQAQVAEGREQRAQGLFELARDLSGALQASDIARLGESAVRGHFGGEALILVADPEGRLPPPAPSPAGFDAALADACAAHAQPTGQAGVPPPASPWHYLPLQAPMRLRGVLALRPAQARSLEQPEQRQHLETLARQVAIALERVHYVEVAQQTQLQMESERLRNTLLATISHDLRTPLTALIGLAEQLRDSQPALPQAQAELTEALADQARALNAMVGNLLDMARLQSGSVRPRLAWGSVEEAVGAALRLLRHVLSPAQVRVALPGDLPLVEFDAALLERVLVNLLENAVRYGAPPIEISVQALPSSLLISIRDHGPGLPQGLRGKEQVLFEKFTRGQAESATQGVGLGLAICKAVVEAHQGQITAANAEGGGACFTLELPRRQPPPLPMGDLPPASP